MPSLEAISLSTLWPTAVENVTFTMHPSNDTEYRALTGLTVYGLDGSTMPVDVTNSTTAEFGMRWRARTTSGQRLKTSTGTASLRRSK